MNRILLCCMALGAALGGLDRMLGNRFGLGQRFEEAFRLLGPIGLSMAGILCLAPLLSRGLGWAVIPVFEALGLDPGMFGGVLAIDMGGYPLSMAFARDPELGRFAGIIVSAIFGCTVVFTVPVGMGALDEDCRPPFIRGVLLGTAAMPVALLAGGLLMGIPLGRLAYNCLPIAALCGTMVWGLLRHPEGMTRCFQLFARGIQALSTLGLTLGAIHYMTGWGPEGLLPLEQAMETVCAIAIVMLGSMPLAELLRRLLENPLSLVEKKTGLNSASTTALLVGAVSVAPALAMFPRMDRRGRVVNGAFLVSGASAFAAHLGFALSCEPQTVPALLWAKMLGGLLGAALALAVTEKEKDRIG